MMFQKEGKKNKTSNEELLQFLLMFPSESPLTRPRGKREGEKNVLSSSRTCLGLLRESYQKASGHGLGGQENLSKIGFLACLLVIAVFNHLHLIGQ